MFDTLPEALDYARRLHARGKISVEHPGHIGYKRDGLKVVWYILPESAPWPSEGYTPACIYPTFLD